LWSNGSQKGDIKWLDKARNRLLVVTLTIWTALAALVGRTWFLAIQYVPVWGVPLEVLAARDFFLSFRVGYGWLFVAFCTSLVILLQVFMTRAQLRDISKTTAGNSTLLPAIIIVGIIRIMWYPMVDGYRQIILPYFLLLLVGLGLPGFLPTYVLYGWWETQHQRMLILLSWRLQISR
jgi:hypothetical protein